MMKANLKHTNKVELKRKIDKIGIIESEQNKISTTIKRKTPLKSDVVAQFKLLQDKFNAVEIENKQNICIIRNLESKLKNQDREKPLNAGNQKLSKDQECQTKAEGEFVTKIVYHTLNQIIRSVCVIVGADHTRN